MPENTGLFKKYDVRRMDGKDDQGAAYFVLSVVNDPFAVRALEAYANACEATLPELAAALDDLLGELLTNQPGPMVEALRTPRSNP